MKSGDVVKSTKEFTPLSTIGMYLWFPNGIPKDSEFTVQSPEKNGTVCVKLNGIFKSETNEHNILDNPMMWIPTEYFEKEAN